MRLALATGLHLAQVCRNEYPMRIRIPLWLVTEAAIICSDIPEVIGEHLSCSLSLAPCQVGSAPLMLSPPVGSLETHR